MNDAPKQIMARSVTAGDQIKVGSDWITVTKTEPEAISKRTVRLCWSEDKSVVLYNSDMVNIRLKEFS